MSDGRWVLLIAGEVGGTESVSDQAMERLCEAIQEEGYRVVRKSTPEDGLALVKSDPSFGVILLDWDHTENAQFDERAALRIVRNVRRRNRKVPIFDAMRAKGNEGLAGLIENSVGSIGYAGYEFARRIGLSMATLEDQEGNFVRPSAQSCAAGLATAEMPDNLRVFVPDPRGADSYLIVTFSWVLLRKSYNNAQTAEAVRKLFRWSLQDGQRFAPELSGMSRCHLLSPRKR